MSFSNPYWIFDLFNSILKTKSVKNRNKIVYKWKEKKVKVKEGTVAQFTVIRSGRTDVTSRIRVKTLKSKGDATAKRDFKFKKEIIEFKPGEKQKVFKVKVTLFFWFNTFEGMSFFSVVDGATSCPWIN